jgi:crotonobetainyl-CoA:carnitine CoA-transferase CaiB-like acyl-CoA transferase
MLLEGVRILDLTRLAPGPFCTMTLGDMGAAVLKVEDTQEGDYLRTMQLFGEQESLSFSMLNRNKRSLALNLKTPQGRHILEQLILEYDVLVEQFRPGAMQRLGLGYDHLRQLNPRLIYCSLTGYGQTGPYSDKVGHDLNYLAMSGMLDSLTSPGQAPAVPGVYLADMAGGGLWAVIGILAAVVHRERTGLGQYIDVSMYDGLVSLLNLHAAGYFLHGANPAPRTRPGYQVYETLDGRYITVAALEPRFWAALCKLVGLEQFIPLQHAPEPEQEAMRLAFAQAFKTKTQAEWTALLLPHETMYAPVKTLEEVFADPHLQARGLCWEIDRPVEGPLPAIGFPVKFEPDPAAIQSPPPAHGEHTLEILCSLGYTESDIERLRSLGVIK